MREEKRKKEKEKKELFIFILSWKKTRGTRKENTVSRQNFFFHVLFFTFSFHSFISPEKKKQKRNEQKK